MSYIIHSGNDIKEMLSVIGVPSLESLFDSIPKEYRLKEGELKLAEGLAEYEVKQAVVDISNKNTLYSNDKNFMGAGVYYHYIPSAVNHLASRAEFYTAYTPYQPEVSQGTLQGIFEFQTYMTRLTGLAVSNASMYDGATALAEAVLMSYRFKKQKLNKVLVPTNLHPEYIKVLKSWLEPFGLIFEFFEAETQINLMDFTKKSENLLCSILQSPNFYGYIEEQAKEFTSLTVAKGGVPIFVSLEPTSLALYKTPAELGFSIGVLEVQSFGNPVAFGGPYAGIITASDEFVRELPGRIVGETTDIEGNRAFVLTLATREQHIRREKATSNICSNQALVALRSCIYLSLLGASGLKDLATINYTNSKNLAKSLASLKGIKIDFNFDFYNEFTVAFSSETVLDKVIISLYKRGINAGYRINKTKLLVAVTELHTDTLKEYEACLRECIN